MLHVNSWLIKFQGLSLIKSWLRSYRRRRPCFCRCALECSFVCFSKRRLSICSSENEFINTKSQKLGAANPPKERDRHQKERVCARSCRAWPLNPDTAAWSCFESSSFTACPQLNDYFCICEVLDVIIVGVSSFKGNEFASFERNPWKPLTKACLIALC